MTGPDCARFLLSEIIKERLVQWVSYCPGLLRTVHGARWPAHPKYLPNWDSQPNIDARAGIRTVCRHGLDYH